MRWNRWALGTQGGRAVVLIAIGLAFFLLTPRWSSEQWQLTAIAGGAPTSPGEVGFSRRIDLNNTGPLKVNDKIAFEVVATDAKGTPKAVLRPQQRLRGVSLDSYHHGRWAERYRDVAPPAVPTGTEDDLPSLGSDQYFVSFSLDLREATGLFLTDPVLLGDRAGRPPVVAKGPSLATPLFHRTDSTLVRPRIHGADEFHYTQVSRQLGATELVPADPPDQVYAQRLLNQPVEGIRLWTKKLLGTLVDRGDLSRRAWTNYDAQREYSSLPTNALDPERRMKVALALNDYLAGSGEYRYSLDLRRRDLSIDPAEDFLINVKQGHCAYYATALALMLRSAGIPARIVNGYRGAEIPEDRPRGTYIVKESHAHSWVEALVANRRAGETRDRVRYYWLTLDPTPVPLGTSATGSFSWSDLWDSTTTSVRNLWRTVFIETQRNPVYDEIGDWFSSISSDHGPKDRPAQPEQATSLLNPWWLAGLLSPVAIIASLLLVRRATRRRKTDANGLSNGASDPEMILYHRWLALASYKLGLVPVSSQTPLEFADLVGRALRQRPALDRWADLPGSFVQLFYRARYGARPLSATEKNEVERRLTDVETVTSEG